MVKIGYHNYYVNIYNKIIGNYKVELFEKLLDDNLN